MSSDFLYSTKLSQNSMDSRENFKVVIRVRPPLPREIDPVYGFTSVTQVGPD